MKDVIIAIDPDIDKNGVAVLYPKTKELSLHSLKFGMLIALLNSLYDKYKTKKFCVVVEAGWANKGNYHLTAYDSKQSAAKKGCDQGRNHQRGIDIVEYCQHYGLPVVEMKPLNLVWKKGKMSHEEMTQYMPVAKKVTNQEERDAALLAWVYADLPLRRLK